MSLNFSMRLDATHTDNLVSLARLADASTMDRLWVSEGEHSAFLGAAVIASHCKRVGLGTGIARAFVRAPWDTAFAAVELNNYAEGRFALGLGAFSQRGVQEWHGMPYSHPAPRLREYVQIVRRLLLALPRREAVVYQGEFYCVNYDGKSTIKVPALPPPPIHLGTEGHLMARVAGEVADGLLCDMLGTPLYLREVLRPAIQRGLDLSARDGSSFEITTSFVCVVTRDIAHARQRLKQMMAIYASDQKQEAAFERHGFGGIARRLQAAPAEARPDLVPDVMIDYFCAVGDPDTVRKAAQRFEGLVTGVRLMSPPFVLTEEEAVEYQRAIIETFG